MTENKKDISETAKLTQQNAPLGYKTQPLRKTDPNRETVQMDSGEKDEILKAAKQKYIEQAVSLIIELPSEYHDWASYLNVHILWKEADIVENVIQCRAHATYKNLEEFRAYSIECTDRIFKAIKDFAKSKKINIEFMVEHKIGDTSVSNETI
jgi:hypothetical protein